jgi:O-antigen ligase
MNRSWLLRIATFGVTVTIPLHNNINSWTIALLCGIVLIQAIGSKLPISRLAVVSAAYFVWLALTWFWDASGGYSFKNLEGYASFLVLPFIISWAKLSGQVVRQVCRVFAITVSVIAVICLVKSFIDYQQTGDSRLFFYHYLSQQMDLNAIFLSHYSLQSIIWLLYFGFVDPPDAQKKSSGIFTLLWVCFLAFIMLLLSSKMLVFLLIITLVCFTWYIVWVKVNQPVLAIVIVGVIAGATIIAVNNLYFLKWRFSVTEWKQYQSAEDNQNGLASRILMWESASELIAERPLLGYGVKGWHKPLMQKYGEKGFDLGVQEAYHSHNQYLQTALMGGVVGLGFLLTILMMVFIYAIRNRNLLLMLVLLHFMIISLVESTFEVQQELVFFLFFMLLFYYHSPTAIRKNKKILEI